MCHTSPGLQASLIASQLQGYIGPLKEMKTQIMCIVADAYES
jgi:hypothetical protein